MKTALVISAALAAALVAYLVATSAKPGTSLKDKADANRTAIEEAQALWK